MSHQHLATYLNDHLAGAAGALELLANIATAYGDKAVEPVALQLHADIIADRQELETLAARLQITQSLPRKMSAWIGEKVAQLKLRLDDPGTGSFRLLESIEAVTVGIEGKRLLWRALEAASQTNPHLRGCDYERLERRAVDQRSRIETIRIEAAKSALGGA